MKIKSVTINKYKSITKPITINFDENLMVFIGKNGSGKSNILEALHCIFSQNIHAQGSVLNRANLDGEITLVLTEEEVNALKKFSDFDGESMEITVGIKEGSAKTSYTIRSSQFVSILRRQYDAIVKLSNNIVPELEKYSNDLQAIMRQNVDAAVLRMSNLHEIDEMCNWTRCKIENAMRYIKNLLPIDDDGNVLSEEEISEKLEKFEHFREGRPDEYDFSFKHEIVFQPSQKGSKYIQIDRKGIKREIAELNQKILALNVDALNAQCKKLSDLIIKYNNTVNMAQRVAINDIDRQYGFWERIKDAIFNKSYWIPSGEMIFYGNTRDEDSLSGYVDYRYSKLFVECFIRLNYSEKNARKLIAQYNKQEKLDIDDKDFCAQLQRFINKDIPQFDNKMFKRVIVEGNFSHIKLMVQENNGDIVPFNATSLGRRWYFTYYFLKNRLGKDDILILDEPASALHPDAQQEILRDIESIAQTHTVIMCTHSPYMISDKVKSVNLVRMEGKSTAVTTVNLDLLSDHKQDIGLLATNDLLLKLFGKTNILCEGSKDIACLYAFMDYFNVRKSDYHIQSLNGFTHLDVILGLYLNNGIPLPTIILDADSKKDILNKEVHIKSDNEDKTIGQLIEEGRVKLFFVGEGKQPDCIEGLFSEEDKEIFTVMQKGKGNKRKVNNNIGELLNDKGCSPETANNFRELFVQAGIIEKNNFKLC